MIRYFKRNWNILFGIVVPFIAFTIGFGWLFGLKVTIVMTLMNLFFYRLK